MFPPLNVTVVVCVQDSGTIARGSHRCVRDVDQIPLAPLPAADLTSLRTYWELLLEHQAHAVGAKPGQPGGEVRE